MKLYAIQRSRSFTDLGPSYSDLLFSNFFSAIMARLIKAKFHVEPPWVGRIKVYSNGPCHMTKMAAMPMYGKNLK